MKLRRNHTKRGNAGMTTARLVFFLIVLVGILYYLFNQMNAFFVDNKKEKSFVREVILTDNEVSAPEKTFLPVSNTGQVVKHKFYTLSYSEKHEQPEWVAYKLTKKSLQLPNVKRKEWFEEDPSVKTGSALHFDYKGSGYSRGHMIPAADRAFSREAMDETFLMSNMSPQAVDCNGGIWNELEQAVRDWAYDNQEVYVVTGPILSKGHIIKKIGKRNKISVPDAFYKIVLDNFGKEKKAIALIIPNEGSDRPLSEYVTTIDEVEKITGIDFFADFLEPSLEDSLESHSDINQWRVEEFRFKNRVNQYRQRHPNRTHR